MWLIDVGIANNGFTVNLRLIEALLENTIFKKNYVFLLDSVVSVTVLRGEGSIPSEVFLILFW